MVSTKYSNEQTQPILYQTTTETRYQEQTFRINEGMLLDELRKLDTSKTPGPDNINNKLIYYDWFELCEIITHLSNLSIQQSFIPTQWKVAKIIPIPKTSNPEKPMTFERLHLHPNYAKYLTDSSSNKFSTTLNHHELTKSYMDSYQTGIRWKPSSRWSKTGKN